MTPEQLHILQHSLGVDKYGQGNRYRDYYCACLDNAEDMAEINALVAAGWMRAANKINEGRDQYFIVTQLGLSAMMSHSPKPPKLTRAKQRYRDFLSEDCGYTFGEWLKLLRHRKRA